MPEMNAAPRCQHIKDDGVRCKSPALTSFDFCYWHHRARQPKTKPIIPLLDNENAIQMVLTQTLQQLQDGTIETRRATAMFRGLTLAMQNVNKLRCDTSSHITSTLTPAMLEESLCGADTPVRDRREATDPTTAAHICHGEGGRQSEPNHPDAADLTTLAGTLSNRKPPISSPDHPITSSPDVMPPDVARYVKKVLRAGPSHPKFAEVSRLYDRYISTRQTG